MKFLKKLPSSDLYKFSPIIVYDKTSFKNYRMPYENYPFAMDGDKLLFIKDYDDFYFHYSVDSKGVIKIESPSQEVINLAMSKKINEVKCVKNMDYDRNYYGQTFCQKILNIKTSQLQTIQYAWSCP